MAGDKKIDINGLEGLVAKGFEVEFHSHAKAILNIDYPETLSELSKVLSNLTISIESLIRGGGGEHELHSYFVANWPKSVGISTNLKSKN